MQKLKQTSSFTLAAQKPQTYTRPINYSCPKDKACYRLPSAVCWEGVARDPPGFCLRRQEMQPPAFRDGVIAQFHWGPFCKQVKATLQPWEMEGFEILAMFSTPAITFIWHNDLMNYSMAEEMPFVSHRHTQPCFCFEFYSFTLSHFKIIYLVQKNLEVEAESKFHSDHSLILISI